MLKKIILRNAVENNWLLFENAVHIINIDSLDDVIPALDVIEQRVNKEHLYAAGFIGYEASPAFDSSCIVKHDAGFPLLRFGLFKDIQVLSALDGITKDQYIKWQMDSTPAYYKQKINQIKSYIHAGDTYQVNYTVRQHGEGVDDPWSLFQQLGPESPYAAYVECDDWAICCASPELFFQLDGEQLESRPMKGTAARGKTLSDDEKQKIWLHNSIKNRAENVMIVDMIRNDIGRVAKLGSVKVNDLFHVETHHTILQMTSTVKAESDKSIVDIFRAMFPCASITGAPKVNTMRLITELEDSPRRIYTGTIGYIAPDRKARFNVAIRTALVNQKNGHVCYGSGGGIVWDSNAAEEFEEINTKSQILGTRKQRHYFQIFESLLWDGENYFLLDRHIDRMLKSAIFFSFTTDSNSIVDYLKNLSKKLPNEHCKIRLLLSDNGSLQSEYVPISISVPIKVASSRFPVDETSIWLAHKTTIRNIYNEARVNSPDADDVLLWNRKGFLTESTIANIIIQKDGNWYTPKLEHGLLPGTYREDLVRISKLLEGDFLVDDIRTFDDIQLLNSVRKWIKIEMI